MRILFVCLGNICRSPTAHGVFRQMAADAGLDVVVDGAGTGAWHIGNPPDRRATLMAATRGYDLSDLRARQVSARDFTDFDLILAMDNNNLQDLRQMAPTGAGAKLKLFMDYAPNNPHREVPDPYYNDGFDVVLDMIEQASAGLIIEIKSSNSTS
ncbi:phosphotyrosine protein phosphatase [Amylibacter kogurei]|uniref:protein-tyrosine-phosphatase n=1 Tax=Paramylibacter kogurei TaxID=1889778 RepID=A0A2G5K1Y6_9RHOB|nr:low molecular weight protein-tyrosine-phosphatase [Amylibacter kogurei]PIB23521.1 phosphotyrosine protein phosphatase [Amylibacter kogurei]